MEVIRALLTAWPEACHRQGKGGKWLLLIRLVYKEWDFLKTIIDEFPHVVTAEILDEVGRVSLEVFELMLDVQPDAPLEYPDVVFLSDSTGGAGTLPSSTEALSGCNRSVASEPPPNPSFNDVPELFNGR